jgi:hypothetical protein
MSTAELLEELKRLSNAERLAVIEAAKRLVRAESPKGKGPAERDNDAILEVAGCLSGEPLTAAQIEAELYGEAER